MNLLPKAFIVSLFAVSVLACSEVKRDPADRYFENKQYKLAVETYTENLKLKPTDVTLLYNRGRAYQEMGELNKARVDFESALAYDSKNFQVLLSLAAVQLEEKNYASALLYATKAEEISGAPAMASFLKARALHQLGLPEDALKAYGTAIQIDRDFGQAYFNRGLLKVALDRKKQACEDFKLATVLEYPGAQDSFDKYCK
jgi:tetratricopeptide (TPR) repeat protein